MIFTIAEFLQVKNDLEEKRYTPDNGKHQFDDASCTVSENFNMKMEKQHLKKCIPYWKWWFSIAMSKYSKYLVMNCEDVFRAPKGLGCLGVKKQISQGLWKTEIFMANQPISPKGTPLRNKGLIRPY